ncbi:MAG: NUDIX hydrolase [Microthrixaceae bacterium]
MADRIGSPGAPLWDPDAVPAATVIVLRDAEAGIEVLMLRRDTDLRFAGGMWVFPGGRIDPADHVAADGDGAGGDGADGAIERAARRAAVREAAEEAGIELDDGDLVRWSHWTPPPRAGHRFSTAFFCAGLADGAATITIDDGEIREHRWMRPRDVMERRDAGEISLAPPTFITLTQLDAHERVVDALEWARTAPTEHFATRIAVDGDVWIACYHGDVAYEDPDDPVDADLDVGRPGPRHRLLMGPTWTYERSEHGTE